MYTYVQGNTIIVKRKKQLKYPPTDEQIKWLRYTGEYYLLMKRNGALIQTTAQMNPENMLNEKSRSTLPTLLFHSYKMSKIDKSIETRFILEAVRGLGGDREKLVYGCKVSF